MLIHTSNADVDAANLKATVYVPVGMNLLVTADCSVGNSTSGQGVNVQIIDNTAGVSISTRDVTSPAAGQILPCALSGVIAGNDADHVISLQWNVTANTGSMRNASIADTPKLNFQFMSQ